MIKNLHLKFGRAPGLQAETICTTPVTVFVGPNNSGKSKILAELLRYCHRGRRNDANVLVEWVEFESFAKEDAENHIKRVTLTPLPNETLQPDDLFVGKLGVKKRVSRTIFINSFLDTNDRNQSEKFCQWFLGFNTLMLDGRERIMLVKEQEAGDLVEKPSLTSLQVLFRDRIKREEVRRIVYDAFGFYFVIDPTKSGYLRIRLSPKAPASDIEEQGLHPEAVQFHSTANHIEQASDGIKAFVGIITAIIAGDPTVILIDEPEAFLHPALSFKLGKEVSQASSKSEKRLFVSTHSPHFVMGCIQSGTPVNIVRLTYRDKVATARVLKSEDLLTLMQNPLLRSTRVLEGLFYEFVVVTESDTDRAFYQEINQRLLDHKPKWGIPNCLFLNAQNKQTVPTILTPLRNLGIPSAGIVDIDALKDSGTTWTNFLKGGFVPQLTHNSLASLRLEVNNKLKATNKDMKRDGGLELLADNDREAANNLCAQLQEYGLFIVKKGEVESWLPNLAISGHGPSWLVDIFQKMGTDPEQSDYVLPNDDDVWAFMAEVKKWLSNPSRKGIPS